MSMTIFKRKIYESMLAWKNKSDGSTALLIEGARRVGKSTIAEEFAKNEYKSYILIDFAMAPKEEIALFNDISDLDYLFTQLMFRHKTQLYARESLIIFDEVQLCPKARQAIKFLVKDHRYDYLETGSLISIKKNTKGILIPSEEHKISMHPLDFEEFLWAQGDFVTNCLLKESFIKLRPLSDDLNRQMMKKYRLYMLVGGMPMAVNEYLNTNNFESVDNVKRDILSLYEDDLRKIDGTGRISLLFDTIPVQLARNVTNFHVTGPLHTRSVSGSLGKIYEMCNSKTVLPIYHANDPDASMSGNYNLEKFKLYLCDTGLFITLAFANKAFTENIIYQKLLSDKKLPANLGYIFENMVAQTLTASGHELFYYTIDNKESRHIYEIDFLISSGSKICPIEVKSANYKTHFSLDVFCSKYSKRIEKSYIIYTKDLRKENNLIMLPIYMGQFL